MGRKAPGQLAALDVKRAKPGMHGDGGGLWLNVRGEESRSWLFRYTWGKRRREMGLGPYPDVGLAEARTKAQNARRLLREGMDPIAHRKDAAAAAAGAAMTFREVAALYVAAHADGWRNTKHRAQWGSTLDAYAHPVFGDRPIAAVDVGDVMRALEPIWREKPETASRVRGRIEAVLDYAAAREWRAGENPARWKGHLANLLPARARVAKVEHHAALPWAEAGAFMAELDKQAGMAALALRFAILTAARTGEVTGATWTEVDLDGKAWTVPSARMKAGREHRVPLSPAALDVLRAVRLPGDPAPGAFVFPGGVRDKGLSNMAMTAVLRRMGRADLTVHGFRSTFRDWCAEQTAHPREVAEAALAHTLRDKVEAAYRRGDLFERRAVLMAEWAAFLARPAQPAAVVPMRRGRKAAG